MTIQFADAYARHSPAVPWLYYEPEQALWVNAASVGRVYRIAAFNTASLTQQALDDLYAALRHVLNALPKGFTVQWHAVVSRDAGALLNALEGRIEALGAAERQVPHERFQAAALVERIAALKINPGGPRASRTVQHYLTVYADYPSPMGLRRNGRHSWEDFVKRFAEGEANLLGQLDHAYRTVRSANRTVLLGEEEFVRLLRPWFGGADQRSIVPGERHPLALQVLPAHLYYDHQGFHCLAPSAVLAEGILSDRHTATFVLEHYPAKVRFTALAALNSLPGDFWLTVGFHAEPNPSRHRGLIHALNVNMGALGSRAGKAKFFKESVVYDQLLAGGENQGFLSSTLLTTVGTDDELHAFHKDVQRVLQSPALGCPMRQERLFGPLAHLAALPFGFEREGAARVPLNIPVLTESARSLLPVFGNHPAHGGSAADGMGFETEEGILVSLNPAEFRAPAKHGLVIGTTGSGKSMLLNRMVAHAIAGGGAAFAIDPGGSMTHNFRLHGGEYHNVSKDHPLQVNLFAGELYPVDPETGQRSDARFNSLLNFLLLAAFGGNPPEATIVNVARSLLGNAIKAAFAEVDPTSYTVGVADAAQVPSGIGGAVRGRRRRTNVTLSVVVAKIEDPSGEFRELAQQLRYALAAYTKGGQYGNFFDHDFPPLTNPVMGINLDEVREDVHLCALLLMVFTSHASGVFQRRRQDGRQELSVLVIDEVHQYLRGSFMQDFIAEQFKVLRKFGVAAVVASQSLADFVSQPGLPNPCGEAVLQSTYYWWLLQQDSFTRTFSANSQRDLAQLHPATLERIMAMRTVGGRAAHAPFYLFSKQDPVESGFFKYAATARELALFSTDPRHNALRARFEREGIVEGLSDLTLHEYVVDRTAEALRNV